MNPQELGDTVKEVVDLLNKKLGTRFYLYNEWDIKRIVELAEAINPRFPLDSLDLMDMVNSVVGRRSVPSVKSIEILKQKLEKADFTRGRISWKYRDLVLIAHYSPKDGGGYDITITGKDSATSFPMTVTLKEWSNMDEESSHGDECPRFNPEHEEDCPVFILSTDGREDHSLNDIIDAQRGCECATDDCGCESEVIRTETITFNTREEWFADFTRWLLAAHWNAMDEYKPAYKAHKLTYITQEGRVLAAECTCGKWVGNSTSDNAERELMTRWVAHVEKVSMV
jgi:hypothetical protein